VVAGRPPSAEVLGDATGERDWRPRTPRLHRCHVAQIARSARVLASPITHRSFDLRTADIAAGRIRVPSATKCHFPAVRAHIDVDVLGELVAGCRWDPGYGSDRERSGIISVGADVLRGRVRPGTQLSVTSISGGVKLS
jgi:hypothetical protein